MQLNSRVVNTIAEMWVLHALCALKFYGQLKDTNELISIIKSTQLETSFVTNLLHGYQMYDECVKHMILKDQYTECLEYIKQ